MWSPRLAAVALLAMLFLPLQISFAQDSLNMTRVGELDVLYAINGEAIAGQYAYLANYTGIRVLDISDEGMPHQVGRLDMPHSAEIIVISDTLAYVGCWGDVRIVNIGDPYHPQLVSTILDNGGYYVYIAVEGGLLCASSISSGSLFVVDISDPASPVIVSSLAGFYAGPMELRDGILYCGSTDSNHGFLIYDFTDPTQPVQLCEIDTLGHTRDVQLRGDSLYVAAYWDGGLRIVDVSNPDSPSIVATYSPGPSFEDIAVDGNLVYAADSYRGFWVLDFSMPNQIVLACTTATDCFRNANHVAAGNSRAFVTTECGSFNVFDTEIPSTPDRLGTYDTPNHICSVAAFSNYLYLPDQSGIIVGDMTDPVSPRYVNSYWINLGNCPSILQHEAYLYVANASVTNYEYGFHILSLADPVRPIPVGQLHTPEGAQTMAVIQDWVYLGYYTYSYGGGGVVVNVDNPEDPVLAGEFELSYPHVFLARDSLLFAASDDGIHIYNAGNDGSLIEIGRCLEGWDVTGLAFAGNYMVACTPSLFWMIDASTPLNPIIVSELPILHANALQTIGNRAYVAAGDQGVRVVDMADPFNPMEVGYYSHPVDDYYDGGTTLLAQDSLIYMPEGDRLSIYQWLPPTSVPQHDGALTPHDLALSAYPNPFNSTTQLRFELAKASHVELSIVNTLGQRVAVLVDEMRAAGNYHASWDASDVASGVYFAHLRAGEQSRVMKMVLMK